MPTPRIYTHPQGPLPADSLPACSAFTLLFPTPDPFPPSAPAFIDAGTGTTLTRGDLRRLALEFAWGLTHRARVPLARGTTVLLVSPNALAVPIALFGAVGAGLVVSPANAGYTPRELAHQWRDARAELVLVHPALVQGVRAMFREELQVGEDEARARIVVADWAGLGEKWLGESAAALLDGLARMDELLGQGTLSEEVRFDGADADRTAYLCYSSGTTGQPKGVITTHRNIVTNILQLQNVGVEIAYGQDVHLGLLPLFHIYGLQTHLHHAFWKAVPVVLIPRFEMLAFLGAIARYHITTVYLVPPIVLGMLHHPATAKHDLTSLRTLVSSAAPLGAHLVASLEAKLGAQGAHAALTQGYGLTETSPVTLVLPRADSQRKAGSVGLLVRSLEARLVLDDGADAALGERGELWFRGPSISKGYWRNETATRDSFTGDGWYKTGDIAVRDDEGFFTIVDRKKELIKYKGFQVPPAELEALLLQHPDIVDAAVIGVDSPSQGTELPRAYIVPAKPPPTPAASAKLSKDVDAWVRERVARHKYLRGGVVVVQAVPKSASGKILRKDLRALAKAEVVADAKAKANAKL